MSYKTHLLSSALRCSSKLQKIQNLENFVSMAIQGTQHKTHTVFVFLWFFKFFFCFYFYEIKINKNWKQTNKNMLKQSIA